MNMEATHSSERLVGLHQITRCYILEDNILKNLLTEKLSHLVHNVKYIFWTKGKRQEFSGTKTLIFKNKTDEKKWDFRKLTQLLKKYVILMLFLSCSESPKQI
jgi:hypothetical protein